MLTSTNTATATLTGDLFFSLFRYKSYYNQPDSIVHTFENYFDTLEYETADKEARAIFNQYKRLKEEKLLYHPFVDISIERDSVVTLYLEAVDYNEIKKFKRREVQDEGKKIRIQADVRKIWRGALLLCDLKQGREG